MYTSFVAYCTISVFYTKRKGSPDTSFFLHFMYLVLVW